MPWPQDAYVGQEVVCINTQNMIHVAGYPDPMLDHKYRIREIGIHDNILCFKLEGIYAPPNSTFVDWYKAFRFRPVQSTSTGFALLTALLNPTNHRHREDA